MAWPIMFIHASYDRIFSCIVDAGFFLFKSRGSVPSKDLNIRIVFDWKIEMKSHNVIESERSRSAQKWCGFFLDPDHTHPPCFTGICSALLELSFLQINKQMNTGENIQSITGMTTCLPWDSSPSFHHHGVHKNVIFHIKRDLMGPCAVLQVTAGKASVVPEDLRLADSVIQDSGF